MAGHPRYQYFLLQCSSIACGAYRPSNHPTFVTHLSRTGRMAVDISTALAPANSSSIRSQPRTVSSPNIPLCLFTMASILSTQECHSPTSRGSRSCAIEVIARGGCDMIWFMTPDRKANVSPGCDLSLCIDWMACESWDPPGWSRASDGRLEVK